MRTRPDGLENKCGRAGNKVQLETNYYRLNKMPAWLICQYSVEFVPEQSLSKKSEIMLQYKNSLQLGGYAFDGTMLYLMSKNKKSMKIETKDANGPIIAKIEFTRTVSQSTVGYMQVLNIILRRSFRLLDLKLVGRNYFDPNSLV